MSDQDNVSTSEAAENQVSTPPVGSNTTYVSSAHFVGHRSRSDAWDGFTEEQNDGSKRQKSDKFDQEACQNELVKMFVATGIPISFVENEAFQKFLKVLQPKFSVSSLSQTTLAQDIFSLWDVERTNLKSFLSQHCGRVCLSIDIWTSCQDQKYTCLTAHFIDNNWKLQKKILNFFPTVNFPMDDMLYTIEWCLNDWGLSRVFSVTVDNVSPYDSGIRCLKENLMSSNTSLVLKGNYMHMYSCAHILNMILKEGLQYIDDPILRISDAVQYIRSSPSMLSEFEACAEQEKIECKGYVYLDIETKWNLSYEMLEAALKHQRAFEDLELQDKKYVRELEKGKGVPTYEDWNEAYLMLPFLKMFREAILRISNTSNATNNIYMLEVFGIGKKISQLCHSKDLTANFIAITIRRYYYQHWENWGRRDEFNMLLLVALVFDPRYKVGYINWMIDQIFDSVEAANLKKRFESCLKSLFEEYNDGEEESQNDSQKAQFDEGKVDPYSWNEFRQLHKSNFKSELNKYLEEDTETSVDLDILNWWKLNSSRFPILANIAREVLAMPVSTLTSEYAFRNNAKVLDSYCSYLNFDLMQALVCTQDWLYGKPFSLLLNKDLEKLKQEIVFQLDVGCSTFATPDD